MPATEKHVSATLSIGEVACRAGVNASTIRFYEREGLLPVAERSSGRRRYDPAILQLLRMIEVSKDAGFSLAEIKRLLHGFDTATPPSARWRVLAEDKSASSTR